VFDTPTIPNFTNCKTKGILRIRVARSPTLLMATT
jgi:hypothetical protein